jgi:polyhydroxyalkanoate synthesis regulator phasin
MADAKARLSLKEVRASVQRMQAEGERLVGRIRRDASALANRSRREAVAALLNDARKFQADLRKRAERAIHDMEARRTRILGSLEEQVGALVERVVKGLNVASADDVSQLRKRIGDLERRIDLVTKERAA